MKRLTAFSTAVFFIFIMFGTQACTVGSTNVKTAETTVPSPAQTSAAQGVANDAKKLDAVETADITETGFVNSLTDQAFGGSITVTVGQGRVMITYAYAAEDPSTEGGKVKFSAPWNGSPDDDGTFLTEGGETFIGYLSQLGVKNPVRLKSVPFTVPEDGKGPVKLVFDNPSSSGEPIYVVAGAKLAGTNQFLVHPARGFTKLVFSRHNPNHPKQTEQTLVFEITDTGVRSVVTEMKAAEAGWLPSREYWEGKGMNFEDNGGRASLKEVYSKTE
jgi:hypothetical protein